MITETFEEATSVLAGFLLQSGYPSKLLWISREDVTGNGGNLFVRSPRSDINCRLYQGYYEFGVRRGLGIRFEVLCFAEGNAFCYVWVPGDPVEASQAVVSSDAVRFCVGIKSGSQAGIQARRVSVAGFALRKAWGKLRGESPLLSEIPKRNELKKSERW